MPDSKIKFDIRNRWTGSVQFTAEIECDESAPICFKIGLAAKWAFKSGADLSGAVLSGAVLSDADLRGAGLRGAVLSGAVLSDADLSDAVLSGAVLSGADLSGADLSGAGLRDADLSDADLSDADLSGAVLSGAVLSGADLRGAGLRGAVLSGAVLSELQSAQLSIVPEAGAYTAWKKCSGGVIVKLLIPEDAPRSNATGRKCRAGFADVLKVFGAEFGVSSHDGKTEYRVGQRVTCDQWDTDRWNECSGGIHHFITRAEAEAY
ncbi:MAG: pentapeptide repeat-containing protein [Betaproteobacteria bacterium]|nr:pentapeptide repeat-containing protein [Betaproteobacteria bacterium]